MKTSLQVIERNRTATETKILNAIMNGRRGSLYPCAEDKADVKVWDNSEFVFFSVNNYNNPDTRLTRLGDGFWFTRIEGSRILYIAFVE